MNTLEVFTAWKSLSHVTISLIYIEVCSPIRTIHFTIFGSVK